MSFAFLFSGSDLWDFPQNRNHFLTGALYLLISMQSHVWSQVPIPLGWSSSEPFIKVRTSLSKWGFLPGEWNHAICPNLLPVDVKSTVLKVAAGWHKAQHTGTQTGATCGTWISISGSPRECCPSLSFRWVGVPYLQSTCCVVSFLRGQQRHPPVSWDKKHMVLSLSTCPGLSLVIIS